MSMELANLSLVGLALAVLLVPLAREYADLRRSGGLGRVGAVGTLALLVPAFGAGLAAGLPLAAAPALEWLVTVALTLVLYSLGAHAVLAASATAPAARVRR